MKSKFSNNWKRSIQPRKQVKYKANAPIHIKRKFISATIDKSLRKKYGRRSIEIRKGDEVKVMRGKFKRKSGKVGLVDIKYSRIQIDGLQKTRKEAKFMTLNGLVKVNDIIRKNENFPVQVNDSFSLVKSEEYYRLEIMNKRYTLKKTPRLK